MVFVGILFLLWNDFLSSNRLDLCCRRLDLKLFAEEIVRGSLCKCFLGGRVGGRGSCIRWYNIIASGSALCRELRSLFSIGKTPLKML